MKQPLQPAVWLWWVLVVATVAMLARHPLYTVIVLLIVQLVAQAGQGLASSASGGMPFSWGRVALAVMGFSVAFNVLFVHEGATVFGRIPPAWPLIGGPLTAEAVVLGLINGLSLLTLLSVFLALNRLVPPEALIRLVPRAFHDLGVVVIIALTYVPETVRHFQRIRDAQAIRGHEPKGVRDWQPLLVPLLVGGLERALALAEAMVARGYGQAVPAAARSASRIGLLVGLVLILAGWVTGLWWHPAGWLAVGAGGVALLGTVWQAGRQVRRTRYRPIPITPADIAVALVTVIPLSATLFWRQQLVYTPFPALTWPPFKPLFGTLLLLLALPLVLLRQPPVEKSE